MDVRGFRHFVVLKQVREGIVEVADPILGNRSLALPEFLAAWPSRAVFVVIGSDFDRNTVLLQPNERPSARALFARQGRSPMPSWSTSASAMPTCSEGGLAMFRRPLLMVLLLASPALPLLAAEGAPGRGLKEIPDPELNLMRGRYTVGGNTVAWFGVTMVSQWQAGNGAALQGALTLGMDSRRRPRS